MPKITKRADTAAHKRSAAQVILFLLLAGEVAFLIFFNLFRFRYAVNFDSSEYLVQLREIVSQGTLFIKDYYYSTMLAWDQPTLLAVPFMMLTGDAALSYGIANSILIVLWVMVLWKLTGDLGYSTEARLLTQVLIFAIYDIGFTDYMEELFLNGALYGFRILFLLILMDTVIEAEERKPLRSWIGWYLFALAGVFIAGASTGVFEAGCCLLPVLASQLWRASGSFADRSPSGSKVSGRRLYAPGVWVCLLALAVSGCGIVFTKLAGLTVSGAAGKKLVAPTALIGNILSYVTGIFQLFGFQSGSPELMSREGIMSLIGAAVALAWLILLGLMVRLTAGESGIRSEAQRRFFQMVIFLFLVNSFVFAFSDLTYGSETCEYRYWLVCFIPLMICAGALYDYAGAYRPWTGYRRLVTPLALIVAAVVDLNYGASLMRCDNYADIYRGILADAEEADDDIIFIYGDYWNSRVMTANAPAGMQIFAAYHTGDDGSKWLDNELEMPRWGSYVRYDGDCLEVPEDAKIAMIISPYIGDGEYAFFRAHATSEKTYEGTNYILLQMPYNLMDFRFGFGQKSGTTRDYFDRGYTLTDAVLTDDGWYRIEGDGGVSGTFQAKRPMSLDIRVASSGAVSPQITAEVTGKADTRTIAGEQELKNIHLDQGEQLTVTITGADAVLQYVDYTTRVD